MAAACGALASLFFLLSFCIWNLFTHSRPPPLYPAPYCRHLLVYDPAVRLSATEALRHSYIINGAGSSSESVGSRFGLITSLHFPPSFYVLLLLSNLTILYLEVTLIYQATNSPKSNLLQTSSLSLSISFCLSLPLSVFLSHSLFHLLTLLRFVTLPLFTIFHSYYFSRTGAFPGQYSGYTSTQPPVGSYPAYVSKESSYTQQQHMQQQEQQKQQQQYTHVQAKSSSSSSALSGYLSSNSSYTTGGEGEGSSASAVQVSSSSSINMKTGSSANTFSYSSMSGVINANNTSSSSSSYSCLLQPSRSVGQIDTW